MPIIQGHKRVNPLDLNKNITIGATLPLDETNFFQGTTDIKTQLKSNLINLLLTHPGERIYLPSFEVGLKRLLFESNIDEDTLKDRIQSQINRFISNIELVEIKTQKSEDKHTLSLLITYKYLLDSSKDTIQLNFR